MTTFNVFLYFLFAYGLSNMLVYGSGPFNILGKFRSVSEKVLQTLGDMLKCMMCTSANVGWIASTLNLLFLPNTPLTPYNIIINDPSLWYIIIFADMCSTSGIVWLLHTAQEALERINNYE